jgi:hypothetical protein
MGVAPTIARELQTWVTRAVFVCDRPASHHIVYPQPRTSLLDLQLIYNFSSPLSVTSQHHTHHEYEPRALERRLDRPQDAKPSAKQVHAAQPTIYREQTPDHSFPANHPQHAIITIDLKKWNRIVQFACSHSNNTKLVTFMKRIWPAQWPRIESNQPGRVCFMIDPQDKAVLERWAASFVDTPKVPPEFE